MPSLSALDSNTFGPIHLQLLVLRCAGRICLHWSVSLKESGNFLCCRILVARDSSDSLQLHPLRFSQPRNARAKGGMEISGIFLQKALAGRDHARSGSR